MERWIGFIKTLFHVWSSIKWKEINNLLWIFQNFLLIIFPSWTKFGVFKKNNILIYLSTIMYFHNYLKFFYSLQTGASFIMISNLISTNSTLFLNLPCQHSRMTSLMKSSLICSMGLALPSGSQQQHNRNESIVVALAIWNRIKFGYSFFCHVLLKRRPNFKTPRTKANLIVSFSNE